MSSPVTDCMKSSFLQNLYFMIVRYNKGKYVIQLAPFDDHSKDCIYHQYSRELRENIYLHLYNTVYKSLHKGKI